MDRTIDGVFEGAAHHWVGDGFRVSNHFPSATDLTKRMSPFFLLDYHTPLSYAPTDNLRRGVGPHPHRGFETVTIAYQGSVAHHDSAGNSGVIRPGEVQWMTAGSGVLHNEYHEEEFARKGGVMQMVQLWVNLPRKHKLTSPKYQALTNAGIPEVAVDGGRGKVRVLAGSFHGAGGPAASFTPANIFDVRLKAGGEVRLTTPKDHNTAVLCLTGKAELNGSAAFEGQSVLFKNDGTDVSVKALSEAVVLFLSGQPIEEPLVHYGPFVMNSVDEINQAVDDFHAGKFGSLEA